MSVLRWQELEVAGHNTFIIRKREHGMHVAYQLLSSTYVFQYPRLDMEPPLEGRFDYFNTIKIVTVCAQRSVSQVFLDSAESQNLLPQRQIKWGVFI